jgi:hypothetical protein
MERKALKLFYILGRIGLLLRSNAYRAGRTEGNIPTDSAKALYALGDALHNLGDIYFTIESGDLSKAGAALQTQLDTLDVYRRQTGTSEIDHILKEIAEVVSDLLKAIELPDNNQHGKGTPQ